MNALEKHEALVAIIRRLENKLPLNSHELQGSLVLDKASLKTLVDLDAEGVPIDLSVDEIHIRNIGKYILKDSQRGLITISYRPGTVYWSVDDFLEHEHNRFIKPKNFYIIENDIESRDAEQNDFLKKYNDVISFIDLLAQLSDVPDGVRNPQNIFFSGAARREIRPLYTSRDIVELHDLTTLRGILLTEVHREEKRGIFKAELFRVLSSEYDGDHILPVLLARYNVLSRRFVEAYNVYIQEFSAKKIIDEIESNNIELTNRLHSVIVDMNKSMFALPIAFIFAATKFDQKALSSVSNAIVIACSWLALGIFFLNLSAHRRTLDFVCAEIVEQQRKAEKYRDLRDSLIPPYMRLLDRCVFQKWLRRSIGVALWVIFIVITAIYVYYTINATTPAPPVNP